MFKIGTTWSSPGIAGPTLHQKAPGIHTIPAVLRPRSSDPIDGLSPIPLTVKNDFFAVAPATILRVSTQYLNDPAFASDAETLIPEVGEPLPYDISNKMRWHLERAAAQADLGLDRVERKEIKFRLARYRRLVDEYRVLRAQISDDDLPEIGVDLGGTLDDTGMADSAWSSTLTFLGGSTDISETPMVRTGPGVMPIGLSPEIVTALAYRAVVDEMAKLLMYESRYLDPRDRITDHGCLVGEACDWLPEMFAADYVRRFQSEREADMKRCIQATPADAAWASDVVTMDTHIDFKIAELRALIAELPFDPRLPRRRPPAASDHRDRAGHFASER